MRAVLSLLVGALVALAGASASGQPHRSYKAPRNAVGQPSFEGVWTTNSLTRLERPDIYPSVVMTEEKARQLPPPPIKPADAVGGGESETYDAEGLALARVGGEVRTAWIVDPPDGRLPFTPQGRARAHPALSTDDPERRPMQERCLVMPSAGPPMTNGLYNNNLQILQTRENVVIYMEMIHDVRVIPIGRSAHGPFHLWMGDSIGRWEGDTFVIETRGQTPAQVARVSPLVALSLSSEAVVTERLRRISPTQILYSYVVEDPANYTKPWRGEMPLNASQGPIYEYACHEGNYSLPNILGGARAQERAAEAGAAPSRSSGG